MNKLIKWGIFFLVIAVSSCIGAYFGFSASKQSPQRGLIVGFGGLSVCAATILWALSKNRKVPLASPAEREAALALQPAPGKASIYLVRKGFPGKLQGVDFQIEGVARGQARGDQFLYVEVEPRTYQIVARSTGNAGETSVTLAAGEVAVFRITMEPGIIKGKIAFQRVDLTRGRKELSSARMVIWA